ncbi:transporter substrate-binding domain-containing protein [Pseudomonas sp. sp1636]|uniref:substrate-binding periplasmic protein n=1 Tax=Pseudomonas sp. sp1636 TaxID=3036707 RepID=UPI0025A5A0C0|nr:transporter substrate-binding domain-containing protein [Pseudomonas sp. sp1636]MDM8347495.1 transporter substrate-binding domain-containing protein [Pseudomonas sp. sp1636]
MKLCFEDQDSYPWVMTDNSGLNLQLLELVEQALALQFEFVAVPWKRCLSGLARGTYDGAFSSSFKAERLALGRYPTAADGRLDERKRLHTSSYALYRRKGSLLGWDGNEFRRLSGRIGSLSGFSIVDFIREHGAEVDESSRDPLALLHMLRHGRIEAAALQSLRADFLLQAHPALAAAIEKVTLPLEEKAYYLMLSNAYVAANPTLAKAIWAEIERQREAPEYRARVQAFLARPAP